MAAIAKPAEPVNDQDERRIRAAVDSPARLCRQAIKGRQQGVLPPRTIIRKGEFPRPEEREMKQTTFHGRVLLPLSVFAEARAGDPLTMERILRYYDGYMNKLCTRTLYNMDGTPHVRVDKYMKHRLQNKLIRAILKDSL